VLYFFHLWLFLCLLAVSVCSQAGVEVVAGDNITLWCRHGLSESDYLFWCKHTNNSVPVYIACRYYSLTLRPNPCRFITENERVEMMVNSENSSLTIRSVNVSDSGLYYCSSLYQKYMIYSHSTYLQIRAGSAADGVFPLLTLLFGSMNAVLLSALLVLIFINQSYRKELREEVLKT
uniref:Ig-like domain-containing protein n=1 Tax=Astyanax mexicanus TaxID=7994 RepID=A0A8B9HCB9_ASTMX